MIMNFELANLAACYDRGLLVPFIGSGMSLPACASWGDMVKSLEQRAGIQPGQGNADALRRCERAIERLRFRRENVAELVYGSIGARPGNAPPPQALLLASLRWPLVCTTNYDDIYMRAVMAQRGGVVPQVFGRSEVDCRRVLQHLNMPVHEALWALQGFLGGQNDTIRAAMPLGFDHAVAEKEIVVGHAEYRKVANRTPHFRRCFAEVFRTRSLLFLGSGLTETYFRSLFDEIIELSGPPVRPHFAVLREGSVDVDFLLRHYNIVCHTYPVDAHAKADSPDEGLVAFLKGLRDFIDGERTRASRWGFHLKSPARLAAPTRSAGFTVTRRTLPKNPGAHEALAVSCGRERNDAAPQSLAGNPLPSRSGLRAAGLSSPASQWHNDSCWVVAFAGRAHVYGIVARELVDPDQPGESPRDRRSPDAIRRAFHAFLDEMQKLGMETVYVPLLAAGSRQVFRPWMSVVQMARAYGEWHRAQVGNGVAPDSLVDVEVCTDDPGVIAMLQGNYIDLSESLEAARLSLTVEIIHEDNEVLRYHRIVDGTETLNDILPNVDSIGTPYPAVYPLPAVHRQRPPADFLKSIAKTVEDFGLVSGSTLVLDFRTSQQEDQPDIAREDAIGPPVTPGVTLHAARPRP
jgi:hypothetical protein